MRYLIAAAALAAGGPVGLAGGRRPAVVRQLGRHHRRTPRLAVVHAIGPTYTLT